MLNFCFITPKRHIIWRITRENRFGGLGCWALEEPKKKPSKHLRCAISRIWGRETLQGIVTKFCILVDIRDVITCASFGDDRLRGLGVWQGSNFPFSHWLASSPLQHSRTTVRRASVWSEFLKLQSFVHNLRTYYQVTVCQENGLLGHAKCVTPARLIRRGLVQFLLQNVRLSSARRSLSPCRAVVLTLQSWKALES